MLSPQSLKPTHPFPARMAASIAFAELNAKRKTLRVLDPMVGSGTTLVVAKTQGHEAIGFDTDPLALLQARVWSLDVDEVKVRKVAERVLKSASMSAERMKLQNAYPCNQSDEETKGFIRYWFNPINRRQLTVLSRYITREVDEQVKSVLWCAFSRLIITKHAGISKAMDLSHSRPHRVDNYSTIRPFDKFLASVEAVLSAVPFRKNKNVRGKATVMSGDARNLPLSDASIDIVITSPPYLNAIDYLRCHKFSLVWMGHSIAELRSLRAASIGCEVGLKGSYDNSADKIVEEMTEGKNLSPRHHSILRRYVVDMHSVLKEISRVLVPKGKVILVVGNSTIRGIFVKNSKAISMIAQQNGLQLISMKSRVLPNHRRYLPPPSTNQGAINNRIRTEVILSFTKDRN